MSTAAKPKISAAQVKKLRELTGAPMMDCKKALVSVAEDNSEETWIELAADHLRKQGSAAAAKKAGRQTSQGMVALLMQGSTKGLVLEINSETDFVAKNELFCKFLEDGAKAAAKLAEPSVEALLAAPAPDGKGTMSEMLHTVVMTLRENITVKRVAILESPEGVVAGYVHQQAEGYKCEDPNIRIGRIGCLVALDNASPEAPSFASKLAMHVAAGSPKYLNASSVPQDAVSKERTFVEEEALASGKPEKMIERIVDGRMKKFFGETCLVNQQFLVTDENHTGKLPTVEELAKKQCGAAVTGFVRFQCGV